MQTIDANSGQDCSIVLDSAGKVHISSQEINGPKKLKYNTNASGLWLSQTLDSNLVGDFFTSIAVDSSDNIHISYHEQSSALKYATNASGSWVLAEIDNSGDVGQYSSIAVDSLDKIHISYYNFTNKDLEYATNASGSWVLETIDEADIVGTYTSIAVGSSDKVHISYFDNTNDALKYATNASGSWVTQTIDDGSPGMGQYSAIAIDSADNVHIGYHVGGLPHAVKYATNASGSWVTSTVVSTADVGQYLSMALDSADNVHFSYRDRDNYRLRYTTNASGSWVSQTVDSTRNAGMFTSIKVDSSGTVHISYNDGDTNTLNYATSTNPTAMITGAPSAPTTSTTATLTVAGVGIISYKYSLDSGTYSSDTPVATQIDLSGLSEGSHTVSVIGKDIAGHWQAQGSATTATWTIDLTAPSGPIVIDSGATYCSSRNVTISLNSGDADYMCFSNDNVSFTDWQDYAPSKSWTLTDGDGTKYVYVKYKDEAGNTATVSSNIILDTLAPDTPATVDIGDITLSEPTLDWDVVSGVDSYIIEYADNSSFTGAVTVTDISPSDYTLTSALDDGTWYWRVKAVDAAGNVSDWSSTGSFSVDTSSHCASNPDQPQLVSPADGAINVSLPVTLVTDAFSDPSSCNTHQKTRWRISESADFRGLVAKVNAESKDLTSYQPSELLLEPNTTYYWKVRYVGRRSNESDWSDVFSFTTAPATDDTDDNGIDDDDEVDDDLDLDSDGVFDNDQTNDIKSIKAKRGNAKIGIRPDGHQITRAKAVESASLSDDGTKPTSTPYDLVAFRLETANLGDTATVKIHLSKQAPENARWVHYDTVEGWQDFSNYAFFNHARDEVTVELRDGGYGDNDHAENGVIIDPSGVGVYSSSSTAGSSSGSGCFIISVTPKFGFGMDSK